MMSSMCSVPIESLTVVGLIPARAFLGRELRIEWSSGMDNERFYVGDVCKQRKELEGFREFPRLLLRALDFKREDRRAPARIIPVIELLRLSGRERGVVDPFDLRMVFQVVH